MYIKQGKFFHKVWNSKQDKCEYEKEVNFEKWSKMMNITVKNLQCYVTKVETIYYYKLNYLN